MAVAASLDNLDMSLPNLRLAKLIIPWLLLIVIGTVMVGSSAVALEGDHLSKHLLYLAIALVVFACVFAVPLRWWGRLYLLAWLGAMLVAIAVLVPGIGHEVNGASRWIRIGGFSLQASEMAKFGLAIYLAGYLQRYSTKLNEQPLLMFVPLIMVAGVAGMLVAEPDLGSAVVIVFAAVSLLFVAGAPLRHFLLLAVVGVGSLSLLVWISPYRMERLIAFLDPWSVAFGSGYQLTQALIAFGRGEWFGLGLGEGIQKLYYLPEAHNDFIFAVVAEELGSIGAIALALLFCYFVLRIFVLARRCLESGQLFAGFVSYFVGMIIGIQFLVNLGVNTGMLPTKGLTLPFVSFGGNSLIVCCALFAMVIRAAFESDTQTSDTRTSGTHKAQKGSPKATRNKASKRKVAR